MVESPLQALKRPRQPSPWVVRHAPLIPKKAGIVLDLAAGRGRHTRYLLAAGFSVLALDRNISGLEDLAATETLEIIEADLEAGAWPLADRCFAGIVVTNYLWRPILPNIVGAVSPGGVLIYETFAMGNERFGKPSNPDYLLQPGELQRAVAGQLEIVAYEECEIAAPRPAVVQRICARRSDSD